MSLSRRDFTAAMLGLPLIGHAASPQKKLAPSSSCTKAQVEQRLRADVICDLQTGHIIHLTGNLSEGALDTTQVPPASITKIQSVMEIMDRIKAGRLKADTLIPVSTYANAPARPYPVRDSILMALNPSLNVLDDIAKTIPDFMASMNARMKQMGMRNSRYLNATGYPSSPEIRASHRASVGDLLRSIRTFELDYARPEVTRELLGLDRITGIWKIAVDGIHRTQNTITLLEEAEGEKALPYKGVHSSKSGLTCEAGFISYVRYDDSDTGRSFIVLTFGHSTAEARDRHTETLLNKHRPDMQAFARSLAPKAETELLITPK